MGKKSIGQHLKEIFIINFNKPLSIKNQFMILFVTLLISTLLFTVVYFISGANRVPIKEVAPVVKENSVVQTSTPTESGGEASKSTSQSSKPTDGGTALFTKLTVQNMTSKQIHDGPLTLVNKNYRCYYNGDNVVSLYDVKNDTYAVSDTTVSVDKSITENVNQMFQDFYSIYGESDVMIACGYRSSEVQQRLYDEEEKRTNTSQADAWVAPANYSEHQTGYAFDLDLLIENHGTGISYDGLGNYQWINTNCQKYGFIVRYPQGKEKITGYEYEPWHFRYVGQAAAVYIMEQSITLEEYIEQIHKCSIEKPLKIIDEESEKTWFVYYVEADTSGETEVSVPQDYSYEISGDNINGYIVTVEA